MDRRCGYNCFQESLERGREQCELPAFASPMHMTPDEIFARVSSSETEIEGLWSELACARDAWVTDGRHMRAVLQAFNSMLNGIHSLNSPALRTSLSELEDLIQHVGKHDPWVHLLEQVIWSLRAIPSTEDQHDQFFSGNDSNKGPADTESQGRSCDTQDPIADIAAKNDALDAKTRELANLLSAEHTARTTEACTLQCQVSSLTQDLQDACSLVEKERGALDATCTLQSQVESLTQDVHDLRRLLEGERALSVALREDLCLRFGFGAAGPEGTTQAKASCSTEVARQMSILREELREDLKSYQDRAENASRKHVTDSCQQMNTTVGAKMEVLEAMVVRCTQLVCQLTDSSKISEDVCLEKDQNKDDKGQLIGAKFLAPCVDVQNDRSPVKVKRMSSAPSTFAPPEQVQKDQAASKVKRMLSLPSNSPRDRQATVLTTEAARGGLLSQSICTSQEDMLQVHSSLRPVHFMPSSRETSQSRHASPLVSKNRYASPPAGKPRQASPPAVHCSPSAVEHHTSPRPVARLFAVPSASSLRVPSETRSVLPVTPRQTLQSSTAQRMIGSSTSSLHLPTETRHALPVGPHQTLQSSTVKKLTASPSVRLCVASTPVPAAAAQKALLTASEASNISL